MEKFIFFFSSSGMWNTAFEGRKRRNEVGVRGKEEKEKKRKKGANMRSESILSNGLLLIYSQPFHFIFTRQQSRSFGAIG